MEATDAASKVEALFVELANQGRAVVRGMGATLRPFFCPNKRVLRHAWNSFDIVGEQSLAVLMLHSQI